jgi:hypothetical protein
VAQLNPRVLGSILVASYDSQGYGGGILSRLHTGPNGFVASCNFDTRRAMPPQSAQSQNTLARLSCALVVSRDWSRTLALLKHIAQKPVVMGWDFV